MVEPVAAPESDAPAHPVRVSIAMSATAMGEIARGRLCGAARPMDFVIFGILTFCFSFFILSDGLKKTPGLLGRALIVSGSRNAL
jgi:hypothetical protein